MDANRGRVAVRTLLSALGRLTVLLAKAIDSTRGVNQALLARIERMALTADVDLHLLPCGARLKRVATGTLGCDDFILRVNAFFHDNFFPSLGLARGRRTLALVGLPSKGAF